MQNAYQLLESVRDISPEIQGPNLGDNPLLFLVALSLAFLIFPRCGSCPLRMGYVHIIGNVVLVKKVNGRPDLTFV